MRGYRHLWYGGSWRHRRAGDLMVPVGRRTVAYLAPSGHVVELDVETTPDAAPFVHRVEVRPPTDRETRIMIGTATARPRGVTPEHLRVPVATLAADSVARDTLVDHTDDDTRPVELVDDTGVEWYRAAWQSWPDVARTLDRARHTRQTPAHHRAVADVYRANDVPGGAPTRAVEDTFAVPRSTAERWIRRARAGGFLPPRKPPRKDTD